MTTWQQFASEAGELAEPVRARFEASRHHVLATLRRDGSPRVSGTEVRFFGPDLTVGSMPGAMKARDLQRDGRFALHANPADATMAGGDAKVAGVAVEVVDRAVTDAFRDAVQPPPGDFHLFRLLLTEVVLTTVVNDEYLLVTSWRPGEPVRRRERR